ncbi:2-hydroxyacid dehydrogenase [Vannielia litorea]|uniref:2-hydroxyacid dehydrogenase n=1 Tax=Vannielia litorea TaxID=1217970 RepID=UPI001C93C97D|nr:glyoxylate/hydroxypyruvate reductase A [Vannielia litorea]MBY6048566.1 glyoxylate/hydroxypyruvate reductase A [Vannielia litorea]MBY6075980.1 glyoxylate/hydroxypyruvate reductase A [Vannielia litorea]
MSRDILAFYSAVDPFEPWRDALAPHLPDVEIARAEDVTEPERVRYTLVWKPPAGFFARFPNLSMVINLGAGVDQLVARDDLPSVPVTRLSDPEMGRMMAGFVLFSVLRHAREIPHFEVAQRESRWSYRHPKRAAETCVAILGLGELGRLAAEEVARQGFDTHGWATRPKDIPGVTAHYGPEALHPLLARADIVVCMLPLTPGTRGMIDADLLAAFKPGAAFVNVSRGEIVDEPALVSALQSGQIGSATLDVFAAEPLPETSPLWQMPGVLVTPHLASVAIPQTAAAQIAANIHAMAEGRPVENRVDPARGY